MILLDTDVCIEILRGNETVIRRRAEASDTVGICFMTVGELFYGASKSPYPERNHSLVQRFLFSIMVIDSDSEIMEEFGRQKAILAKKRLSLPDADILIAAACCKRCEVLVTGNTKHFSRFSDLKIENWLR